MSMMHQQFKAARRAGTPILGIRSFDQESTYKNLLTILPDKAALFKWDLLNGGAPTNDAARMAIALTAEAWGATGDPVEWFVEATTMQPVEFLRLCAKLPQNTVLFMQNAHRFVEETPVAQAIMNLRARFESQANMLVLLGPDFTLPAELRQDVVLLEENLPTEEGYATLIAELMETNRLPSPTPDDLSKASTLLKGLGPFRAKQTAAMSMSKKKGIDLATLREFKRQAIAEHKGITMDTDDPLLTFDNIGGLQEVTSFFHRGMTGPEAPLAVFRIDELEKALAGAGGRNSEGDSSGTSQDALLNFLNAIEDKGWSFAIFLGPGGSGKSLVTKCLGPTFGIPSFTVDLGGTKGPLVGESQQNIRSLLNVMDGIAGSRALIIGTCNKLESIPPELKRRVTDGFWFFDIPTADELLPIWTVNKRQFGLEEDPTPACPNWTGAEVRNCCRLARKLQCSLEHASKYIVPIWLSGQKSIQELRNMAHETFLSASVPGSYRKPLLTAPPTPKDDTSSGRTLRLHEEE